MLLQVYWETGVGLQNATQREIVEAVDIIGAIQNLVPRSSIVVVVAALCQRGAQ